MNEIEKNYMIEDKGNVFHTITKEDRERAFVFLWDNLKEILYKNDNEKNT